MQSLSTELRLISKSEYVEGSSTKRVSPYTSVMSSGPMPYDSKIANSDRKKEYPSTLTDSHFHHYSSTPPVVAMNRLAPVADNQKFLPDDALEEVFHPDGLLGRTYTRRQQKREGLKSQSISTPSVDSETFSGDHKPLQALDRSRPNSVITIEPPRGRPHGLQRNVTMFTQRTRSRPVLNTAFTPQRLPRRDNYHVGVGDGDTDIPRLVDYATSPVSTTSLPGTALRREQSISSRGHERQMPKPLLDFTPVYQEAPQWDKSKKGHGFRPTRSGPLVDFATSPVTSGVSSESSQTALRRKW